MSKKTVEVEVAGSMLFVFLLSVVAGIVVVMVVFPWFFSPEPSCADELPDIEMTCQIIVPHGGGDIVEIVDEGQVRIVCTPFQN